MSAYLLEEEATALWRETYREIAIEEMLRTVEEAMSRVIDCWGDHSGHEETQRGDR